MNKKIISLITAATMVASTAAVMADSPSVNVVVNGAKINFADQNAVIENDRTLIPARGAFEAMDCKVEWDGEARTVTVTNSRNTKIAVLTIDSDKMAVTTYKSLFDVEKTDVTLDVPAQIMNDRTMIPLRAVGEAMGATVNWDGETYTASITTTDGAKAEAEKDKLTSESKDDTAEETKDTAEETTDETAEDTEAEEIKIASVSLSQVESENDDEVVVSVDLKGMELYPEHYIGAVTLTLKYDCEALELVDSALTNEGVKIDDAIGESFVDKENSQLRVGYITVNEETAAKTDGSIMKLTFKKLKDEATDIVISSEYDTTFGYDTSIGLDSNTVNVVEIYGTKLIIDDTPLTIK